MLLTFPSIRYRPNPITCHMFTHTQRLHLTLALGCWLLAAGEDVKRGVPWAACVFHWVSNTSCSRSSPHRCWQCRLKVPHTQESPPAVDAGTAHKQRHGAKSGSVNCICRHLCYVIFKKCCTVTWVILLWLAKNIDRFWDSWMDCGSAIFLRNWAALEACKHSNVNRATLQWFLDYLSFTTFCMQNGHS